MQCKELIAQEEDSSWCNGIVQFGSINNIVVIKTFLGKHELGEEHHIVLFKDDFIAIVDELIKHLQKKSHAILLLYNDHIFVLDRILSPNALNYITWNSYDNYFGVRPFQLPTRTNCHS